MSGIDGFNPTHRVIKDTRITGVLFEAGHELEMLLAQPSKCSLVLTDARGIHWTFNLSEVEEINTTSKSQSQEMIPSKRYRWTVEGVAIDRESMMADDERGTCFVVPNVGTCELLPDPLPDAVDSVVLLVRDNPVDASNRQRIAFQLDEDGWSSRSWRDPWTTETLQAEVGGPLNGELIVLFDANETETQ